LLPFLIQLALLPLHPALAPFVFFYVGVVVATWFGGLVTGLAAVALSALLSNYAFIPPSWEWSTSGPELIATALFLVAGSVVAVLCAAFRRSLADAQRIEEALRDSESRFRTMADSAPLLIWMNGLTGCDFVNRGYLEFLGRSPEEIRGMDWAQFLHPDDAEGYVAAYLKAFDAQELFDADVRFRRADGVYRWLKSRGVPRFSSTGEFLGYVGCSMDVTDAREAQAALRREREQAR
jgi:PAS domain S-box-containing protein